MFKMMRKGIFEEIIPSMDGDREELSHYAEEVLERFANPYIKHRLLSISLNSVSKFKNRVLPSLMAYLSKMNRPPPVLCFSLAALIAFYEGQGSGEPEFAGSRNGVAYPIRDDAEVLKRFVAFYAGAGEKSPESAREIVHAVLSAADWWGLDLSALPGLEDAVAAFLGSILQSGMKSVIAGLV
jgi:tagaturonate reductase